MIVGQCVCFPCAVPAIAYVACWTITESLQITVLLFPISFSNNHGCKWERHIPPHLLNYMVHPSNHAMELLAGLVVHARDSFIWIRLDIIPILTCAVPTDMQSIDHPPPLPTEVRLSGQKIPAHQCNIQGTEWQRHAAVCKTFKPALLIYVFYLCKWQVLS